MKILLLFCALLVTAPVASAGEILPVREQARVIDEILAERLDGLLPVLMQRNGIDLWIVVSREYNEDPVLRTMLPATWLNARRRTILVFSRDGAGKFEKLAVARYNVGDRITAAWDMQQFLYNVTKAGSIKYGPMVQITRNGNGNGTTSA